MTTQNMFYATPRNSAEYGFVFTDLESFQAEYDHRRVLFGTVKYEFRIIHGNQIDIELFAGLKINHTTLIEWFNEIQHLTNKEKVGLWFLVSHCGYGLVNALAIIQDGMTIFHGDKQSWACKWLAQNFCHPHLISSTNINRLIEDRESRGSLREFHFAGETWVGNPLVY